MHVDAFEALLVPRQPSLRRSMLPRQPPDDERQHDGDDERGRTGGDNQGSGLRAPVGERRGDGRRREHRQRKLRQAAGRQQPLLAVDRADQARAAMVYIEQGRPRRCRLEISPDHPFSVRKARDQRSIAVVHGNRRIFSERNGRKELLESLGRDRPRNHPQKFAARPDHLAGDYRSPAAGITAAHHFDLALPHVRTCFQGFIVSAVRDVDIGHLQRVGRTDQGSFGVVNVDAGDFGGPTDLGLDHQVCLPGRQLAPEVLRRGDAGRLHVLDEIVHGNLEVGELLIEMARQQQHGVLQLAFAALQRAIAEIADRHRGADRDRRNQQHAASNQPANRIAAARGLAVRQIPGFDRRVPAAHEACAQHRLFPRRRSIQARVCKPR